MSQKSMPKNNPHPTPTIEDYLMTMHVLERDQGVIVAARLVEHLNVTAPTVAVTLKRMERDDWITGKGSRAGIRLTAQGRAAAHSVVRRHMLTEWLLLKILKVPLMEIHTEAHHLEHAISDSLEARLVDVLGAPRVCPHGNPFPGQESVTSGWLPLTDMDVSSTVTVRRLHEFAEDDQELLAFLSSNGILPGAALTIEQVQPFNQTMTVRVGDRSVVLGLSIAGAIYGQPA